MAAEDGLGTDRGTEPGLQADSSTPRFELRRCSLLVLAVVLLEPDSITALLAPIVGFALVALIETLDGLVAIRSGVRSIVRLTHDQTRG